jgi:hypothetical protein
MNWRVNRGWIEQDAQQTSMHLHTVILATERQNPYDRQCHRIDTRLSYLYKAIILRKPFTVFSGS